MSLLSLTGLLVSRFRLTFPLILLGIASLSACDKVALLAPTDSTIALSINTTVVPVNGSATVIASVIEKAGTPVQNGTSVSFTSTFGHIEPAEARTEGGKATVTFTGTSSGKATITAFSGGAKAELSDVLVGGAAAGSAALRASPSSLPQTGGTTDIFVTVRDASGNLLPGAPVSFTTDQGTLAATSAITDATGEAKVSLTTNRDATVTATVISGVTATVAVKIAPAPTVTLTSCTTAPQVGVAVNCTITPAVQSGGVAVQNVTINWGDGSGEQPLGNVTGASVASHTFTSAGTYTVQASATDLNGQRGTAVATLVVQRVLPTVTISATSTSGSVGVPISFTVTPQQNPPQPITGIVVDFGDGGTRNLGVITGATTVQRAYTSEGTFTVTATVTDQSNQRGSASVQVTIGRANVPTVTFSQNANLASGGATFTVSATASTGLFIRSIVVKRFSSGATLYDATGGGTFYADGLVVGDVLTATATDSAGATGSFSLIVK